jgi:carbon storage regulator CsrA
MLVLSRTPGEAIVIRVPPSDTEQVVKVTYLENVRSKARIGVDASRSVVIHREEVDLKVRGEAPAS